KGILLLLPGGPKYRNVEQGQARKVKVRLRTIQYLQQVSRNVRLTCQFFGIFRSQFYIWLRRYKKQRKEGLQDQSRRPLDDSLPHPDVSRRASSRTRRGAYSGEQAQTQRETREAGQEFGPALIANQEYLFPEAQWWRCASLIQKVDLRRVGIVINEGYLRR